MNKAKRINGVNPYPKCDSIVDGVIVRREDGVDSAPYIFLFTVIGAVKAFQQPLFL